MTGKILGTGSYVPGRTVENDDLARLVDTNDAWIRERTGIERRHVTEEETTSAMASRAARKALENGGISPEEIDLRRHVTEEETTSAMASRAARKALENGGISPEEIDLILVATSTPDIIFPCVACRVQKEIGAVNAVCFDLNAACSGFLFAYQTAQAYIQAGIYQKVLLIGADSMSQMVDWSDRGTCILFGDGAGAAVLSAEETGLSIHAAHRSRQHVSDGRLE